MNTVQDERFGEVFFAKFRGKTLQVHIVLTLIDMLLRSFMNTTGTVYRTLWCRRFL